MPVSFLPNPDYDYAAADSASTPKKSFEWLGTINNVISSIGGVLGLIKKTNKPAGDSGESDTQSHKVTRKNKAGYKKT